MALAPVKIMANFIGIITGIKMGKSQVISLQRKKKIKNQIIK